MKGIAALMFVTILMVIAATIVPMVGVRIFSLANVQRHQVILNKDAYTMNNALDAARVYMENALNYSVYQGCYDASATQNTGNITEELKVKVTENIKKYTGGEFVFLGDYVVDLPEYAVSFSNGTIKATPDKKFSIKMDYGNESITIRKSSGLSTTAPCMRFYEKASEINKTLASNLSGILHAEVNNQSRPHNNTAGKAGSCAELFQLVTGRPMNGTEEEISQAINQSIAGIKIETLGYPITTTDGEVRTKIRSAQLSREVDEQTGSVAIECSFIYEADSRLGVVASDSKAYPVSNGTEILFERARIRLEISAKSTSEGA